MHFFFYLFCQKSTLINDPVLPSTHDGGVQYINTFQVITYNTK